MMKYKFNFLFFKILNLFLFLILLFNASGVRANMAAPSRGGRMSGEPSGLEKIFIKHETLTIDFRALGDKKSGGGVSVEAVYEIENKGAEQPLELVFALGWEDAGKFTFYLDDAPVRTELKQINDLPKNWQKPRNTLWINGKEVYYNPIFGDSYNNASKNPTIKLVIPQGNHRLKAAYQCDPTRNYAYAPVLLYQFAYILAPAKDWAGFGGLDVTVNYPAGWKIVTDPGLEQNGEILTKHFDSIPADAITFTLGKPMPQGYFLLNSFLFILFLFCLFGIPLFIIFIAVRNSRKNKFVQPAKGLLWSLLWAILTGVSGFCAIFGADYFYPAITFGYGEVFYLFFLLILCFIIFVIGSAIWAIYAAVSNKRKPTE